jgi:hypothetical protein
MRNPLTSVKSNFIVAFCCFVFLTDDFRISCHHSLFNDSVMVNDFESLFSLSGNLVKMCTGTTLQSAQQLNSP